MGDAPDVFPAISADAINDRLVLSSRPQSLEDFELLRQRFVVSHVVNVCEVDDSPTVGGDFSRVGVTGYLWAPVADDGKPKPADWFKRGVAFALAALARPGWVVCFHCQSGLDRSAAMLYAALRALGFTRMQAIGLITRARPLALPAWGIPGSPAHQYLEDADEALIQGW